MNPTPDSACSKPKPAMVFCQFLHPMAQLCSDLPVRERKNVLCLLLGNSVPVSGAKKLGITPV